MSETNQTNIKIGVVFLDDKREGKDKTGREYEYYSGVTEDGHWINAYINISAGGTKYLSLVKGNKKENIQKTDQDVSNNRIDPSDLPF